MQDLNDCKFTGRLVNDPQVNYTSGTQMAIASLTLAIDRGKDKDGEDKGRDFPMFKAFAKTAENIERLLHKGDKILISKSHVQTGKYENKETGKMVYTTDFIIDNWQIMGQAKKNADDNDYNQKNYNDGNDTYNWGR